jgi:hypothetical protein
MMRRHYHVEDTDADATLSAPIGSFREAKSEAFQYVRHARITGLWSRWAIDWSDRKAGYHRWAGLIKNTVTRDGVTVRREEKFGSITVIPCTKGHEEVQP